MVRWMVLGAGLLVAAAGCSDTIDDDAGTGGRAGASAGGSAGSAGGASGATGMGGAAGGGGTGCTADTCCGMEPGLGDCESCSRTSCCDELVDCVNEADGRCADRPIAIDVDADDDGATDFIDIDDDGVSDADVEGEFVCMQVCVNHFFNVAEAAGEVLEQSVVFAECGAACADPGDIAVSPASNSLFGCLVSGMPGCEIECGLIQ